MALGILVRTAGSTYRKPGAMLLIAGDGEYAGLISGGCLEGDLGERARTVIATGRARLVTYDLRSSDDLVWGLGLGCEGAMHILLLRVGPHEEWQPLAHLAAALAPMPVRPPSGRDGIAGWKDAPRGLASAAAGSRISPTRCLCARAACERRRICSSRTSLAALAVAPHSGTVGSLEGPRPAGSCCCCRCPCRRGSSFSGQAPMPCRWWTSPRACTGA